MGLEDQLDHAWEVTALRGDYEQKLGCNQEPGCQRPHGNFVRTFGDWYEITRL